MEKCNERDIELHIVFIDLKHVVDKVPQKIINLIMMTMKGSKARANIENQFSNPLPLLNGSGNSLL